MKVYITNIGCVSPWGENWQAHLQNSDVTGFSRIESYDSEDAKLNSAGEIKNVDCLKLASPKLRKYLSRRDVMLLAAAHDAMHDINLPSLDIAPERRGIFVGSASSQIEDLRPYFNKALSCVSTDGKHFDSGKFGRDCLQEINPISAVKLLLNGGLAHLCQQYDARGANANFMDFNCSGIKALAAALSSMQRGDIDWALVGAVSAPIDPFTMSCAFQQGSPGMMSEGAIFFVLQSEKSLSYGKATALAEVVATGSDIAPTWDDEHAFARAVARSGVSTSEPATIFSVLNNSENEKQFYQRNLASLTIPFDRHDLFSFGCFSEASGLFALGQAINYKVRTAATFVVNKYRQTMFAQIRTL